MTHSNLHQAFHGLTRTKNHRSGPVIEEPTDEPLADFIERRIKGGGGDQVLVELSTMSEIADRVVAAQAAALSAGTSWAPAPVLSASDARALLTSLPLDEADLDDVIRILTEAGVLARDVSGVSHG